MDKGQGVVQKMKIDKWKAKHEEDGEYTIWVMDHKTTDTFGPARVVVSFEIYDIMEMYYIADKTVHRWQHYGTYASASF